MPRNSGIDGAFIESHGREVMDIIKPTNGQLIARVTLADEEDTRRAIAAAKRAFASFGRTTKDERLRYLRQLHKAVSAHIDDLTAVMIEEYGGVARFARLIVESGVNAFGAAEKALQELPLAIDALSPGSIQIGSHPADRQTDLLYFSLVTLATIGYGDIVPLSGEARILAALEGVTGVLYIAITVALLVGRFRSEFSD